LTEGIFAAQRQQDLESAVYCGTVRDLTIEKVMKPPNRPSKPGFGICVDAAHNNAAPKSVHEGRPTKVDKDGGFITNRM
jgi:hypothetical protein